MFADGQAPPASPPTIAGRRRSSTAVDWLTPARHRTRALRRESGQDERAIMRGNGPPIAMFKDPAGNILSMMQTDS